MSFAYPLTSGAGAGDVSARPSQQPILFDHVCKRSRLGIKTFGRFSLRVPGALGQSHSRPAKGFTLPVLERLGADKCADVGRRSPWLQPCRVIILTAALPLLADA